MNGIRKMRDEKEKLKKLLLDIGHLVEAQAVKEAPRDTSRLADDIQVFTDNLHNLTISIGNSKAIDYAPFVHEGTGIYGKKKRPYGRKKNIKGQKPQPYLEDALQEVIRSGKLNNLLNEFADEFGEDVFQSIKNSLSALEK